MNSKTKIEWVKNPDGSQGYTWNPITGCLNGCTYCYARKLANSRLKARYLANSVLPTHDEPEHEAHHTDPFYPRFWPEKLMDVIGDWTTLAGRQHVKSRGIFVCDMSDLFGIGIPEDWTNRVMEVIRARPEHRFYLLTKQPQTLIKFSPFPDNCYVGVSATNQEQLIDALQYLSRVEATVKYLSCEPLLEQLNGGECEGKRLDGLREAGISWVIIGAQTPDSPRTAPRVEWVKEIIDAADKANIPVFLKRNLGWLKITCEGSAPFYRKHESGTWVLRQEMPHEH